MRNAIKMSVHFKSVTSLNMIFPILPFAANQSFTKTRINSSSLPTP